MASLMAQIVNSLLAMQETWVRSLGWEDPLERGMATLSSTLAWRISWTEEPGRLLSMGSQRVRHDWRTHALILCKYDEYYACVNAKLLQSCLTLCDPMDCSLPGSSVHGILQASILEWVAIPFLQGIFLTQGSNLDLLHCRQILYHLSHKGSS